MTRARADAYARVLRTVRSAGLRAADAARVAEAADALLFATDTADPAVASAARDVLDLRGALMERLPAARVVELFADLEACAPAPDGVPVIGRDRGSGRGRRGA
jgi:hypothetical protein